MILLALSALVFVRIGYVYPSRTPVLRTFTVLAGVAWGALLLVIVLALPERRTGLAGALARLSRVLPRPVAGAAGAAPGRPVRA